MGCKKYITISEKKLARLVRAYGDRITRRYKQMDNLKIEIKEKEKILQQEIDQLKMQQDKVIFNLNGKYVPWSVDHAH